MRTTRQLVLFALVSATLATAAHGQQAVAGLVADTTGLPLPGVRVAIVALGRTNLTGDDGRYRFGAVPAGRYTVSFARIGYAPEARTLTIGSGEGAVQLDVRLRETRVQLAPVQVTATTAATRAQDSPQPTSVVEGAELRSAQSPSLGETLEMVPGVRSLGMTTGIGKPVIRGMTHYRVVTLDNGQRTETQAWGHDHSPNVETAAAERVEVIKGPSSVLYGSDALGGVINVVAPPVPDALDVPGFVRGRLTTAYNHNVRGADGTLAVEGARGGLGLRGALTVRGSGDMRTPAGTLGNTNNRATATELALGHRGARGQLSARYTGRDERIEIYDDPALAPGYSGYQLIGTHRASVELLRPVAALGRLQASAGYEQNLRREFASIGAPSADLGLFVRNWTGFAHLHHAPVGPLSGTVGVSGMTSAFENQGTKTLIPDSETRNAAVYAFEEMQRGRWRWTAGARYDYRSLGTEGNALIDVPAQTRHFHAATGSAGALFKVSEPVALVMSVARGFRAPAAPDLFANGFHEGTRAFERGDPDLAVETSLNTDVGIRVSTSSVTAEATGFVNRVSDYIYLRPFGAGGGTFDSLQVVQGDARLVGVEARAAWRALDVLTLQASADWIRGQNTAANVPLTFIPPPRVLYGARLETPATHGGTRSMYFTAQGETNARQSRLDPRDIGPPGYTTATFGAGIMRLVPRGPLTVDLSVRNAFDVRYRSFMSRYKAYADAPGRTLVLRISTGL